MGEIETEGSYGPEQETGELSHRERSQEAEESRGKEEKSGLGVFSWLRRQLGVSSKEPRPEEKTKVSLRGILSNLRESEEVFDFVTNRIQRKNPDEFQNSEDARNQFSKSSIKKSPIALARLIERNCGTGSLRALRFLKTTPDAEENVLKILKARAKEANHIDQEVREGMYLGIMETYDVQWSPDKVARDAWQNFFDANGQTLDGLKIQTESRRGQTTVKLFGPQGYDWRELIHIGATTKADSDRTAGGFGEGAKILAFILLRDYGARSVSFSSRDWKIDYYLDDVPEGSYYKKAKGLYVRKTSSKSEPGSSLEVTFDSQHGEEMVTTFEQARQFFYSSENKDFRESNYNNPQTGGFKVLPMRKSWGGRIKIPSEGNFYMCGQRIHFESKDEWNTVEGLNIWIWSNLLVKDRDRGNITRQELSRIVIPHIVNSMDEQTLERTIYDMEDYWNGADYHAHADLLEAVCKSYSGTGKKLEFPDQYVARNIGFGPNWITEALKSKGFIPCHGFLSKVGMVTETEVFKRMQEHYRVEPSTNEQRKINLLKQTASELEVEPDFVKDIWLFSQKDEKNIFSGKYNDMFYWISREQLSEDLMSNLHTYLHEVAHKSGHHGEAKFDYDLQALIQKIHRFTSDHPERYQELREKWEQLKEEA